MSRVNIYIGLEDVDAFPEKEEDFFKMIKVENMTSTNGNKVANQFIISKGRTELFQSYDSLIALTNYRNGKSNIYINDDYYKYSRTTSKYLGLFLNRTSKEIEKDIKDGNIKLVSGREFNKIVEEEF